MGHLSSRRDRHGRLSSRPGTMPWSVVLASQHRRRARNDIQARTPESRIPILAETRKSSTSIARPPAGGLRRRARCACPGCGVLRLEPPRRGQSGSALERSPGGAQGPADRRGRGAGESIVPAACAHPDGPDAPCPGRHRPRADRRSPREPRPDPRRPPHGGAGPTHVRPARAQAAAVAVSPNAIIARHWRSTRPWSRLTTSLSIFTDISFAVRSSTPSSWRSRRSPTSASTTCSTGA